ncbi:hypothetical protein MAC_00920 [Metarhizium acridum CQMa 102]|uniref:Uncharacterized protein n=1 Tax=Metarhizium acridum (strain CQMa 102) TaxID=655827 RepID=E9DT38_METAQ|nr:uncharacterized protein MAC_00920 [Metarhizium acridum CQMa 102]EFY93137.1 hypothetical protein MAC_00920 [Metarhizium acridum CQMa 102]
MTRPASLSRRFTLSSRDDADSSLSHLGSSRLSSHRRSHTGVEARHRAEEKLERPCSEFQLHSISSNLYAGDLHDTMLLGEGLRARRARDDVAALVDFLKNHPPPPDNFMSIPYGDEGHGRGRWSKIKKIGRRSKSMPKQPQNIQLPDSAVAGITTGGHRHIAISIPIEAIPYGFEIRSQYPVFTHDTQIGTPSKGPIRTFRNEKGVVTVLRPVTEVYESDAGSVATKSRSPYLNSQGHRPPLLPPHKPTNSLTGQVHDYIGILPTKFDTPLLHDSSAPWHILRSPSRDDGSVGEQNPAVFRRSAYPARASSMVSNRSVRHPPSIDGLISPQDQVAGASNGARSKHLSNSLTQAPLQRALSTSNNNHPVNSIDAHRSESGPSYIRDLSAALSRDDSQNRNTASKTDAPVLSHSEDYRHASSGSSWNRKDIVRERKRRDIEAAKWNAKVKDLLVKDASKATQRPSTAQPSSRPAAAVSDETSNAMPGHSTLTLSDLMVVMDVEPSFAGEKGEPVRPKTAPAKKSSKADFEMPLPSTTVNTQSILTPPASTCGSPSQQHGVSDRTSLTRRREWKAIREQERRARDAMAMARARTQQLASGGVAYENGSVSQADKEVMRLYEAYREHRLRDMERRLRRLERNGDVWLQALDNMNKTMASSNNWPFEDIRDWPDWASDGETSGTADRTDREMEKTRLTRRPSLSQAGLLEKLNRHANNDDAWSDSVSRSDDASGLGTIEPLMRELAGEARRWQETTQSPVITKSGQFHAI